MSSEPYFIRVPAWRGSSRRARLALVRRLRRRLLLVRRRRVAVWAWAALLVWIASPLQTFLSGVDPALPGAAQDATPLYRYARYAAALAPLAVLAWRGERLTRLVRAGWPMLAFLAYATASLLWSQDRETSFKAILSGGPMLLGAAGLAVALRPMQALRALHLALALSVMGSVAAVLLLPRHAIAGAHDVLGASAPGDWRGLYGHKNTLGHVAAITIAVFGHPGAGRLRLGTLRPLALAAAVACLAGSRCMSGLAIASLCLVLLRLPRDGLLAGAAVAFGVAGLAAAFAARALVLALAFAAVGRDATLSGRTEIWRHAVDLASHHAVLGWGLDYAVSPPVAMRLTRLFGVDHVHSAALDLYFSLGAVGVFLAGAALGWALLRPASPGALAASLRAALLGWVLSGLTEDMGVRTQGPVALFGLCALMALYGLRSGRERFLRPRFRFDPAWMAPLRPPRLRAGA